MSEHEVDVMDEVCCHHKVLDQGFVRLVDIMPRLVPQDQTADSAIVQAARVSYGEGTTKKSQDRELIRYLLRNKHTSPFEMINLKWHAKMPIFVARQWIRHRTASVNEYSGRYSKMRPEFFNPDEIRKQDAINRQGTVAEEDEELFQSFMEYLGDSAMQYDAYEKLIDRGLGRELARIGLPLSMYTEWYWEIDLHNFMHFLRLRMDSHAQQEIQAYANAMYKIACSVVPLSMEAFKDYVLKAVTFTGPEVTALAMPRQLWRTELGKTELAELEAKWDAFTMLTGRGR